MRTCVNVALRLFTCDLEFDKLARMVQHQNNIAEAIPPFYVRTLVSLENSLATAIAKEKDSKKKMNATNNRALNAMKQKVKKAVKENEKEIKQYQAVCCLSTRYSMPSS